HNVECSEPRADARLLGKLDSELIEPLWISPTLVDSWSFTVMPPLSKLRQSRLGLGERFEGFKYGKEIWDTYTELKDLFEQ
ncbi:uncharacterized protein PHACADRAFT_107097, partial [Phanerochaete carnosa HHB-10118-sp]